MADERSRGSGDASKRPQDPLVARLRPDPTQPPRAAVTLTGLLGDSDRPGYRRLYLTTDLGYFAEFRTDDVIDTAPVAADDVPFPGHEATRITIARDAPVQYTHTRTAAARDEFDLDVRLGPAGARAADVPDSFVATCWQTCAIGCIVIGPIGFTRFCNQETVQITVCRGRTCIDVDTCVTCPGDPTCETCHTACGQATCGGTCQTCNTACGQATCQTCQTACGQATCQTCHTNCDQATCETCQTNCGGCFTDNRHVFTCGNHRQCV